MINSKHKYLTSSNLFLDGGDTTIPGLGGISLGFKGGVGTLFKPRKTQGYVDHEEIKNRQRWAESQNKTTAGSEKGAKGLYQIMPNVLSDYNNAHNTTYTEDDLYNADINTKIRDWYSSSLYNSTFANKPLESTDSIRTAKELAAYNWGRGHVSNSLQESKDAGIDIYDSWEWLNSMPKETQDYVNFILRGQNTGGPRNNELYEASKKEEGGNLNIKKWDSLSLRDKSEIIRVGISNGLTTVPDIKEAYNKFAEGGDIKENPLTTAMTYLMSKGISKSGAAAIIGTLQAESGLQYNSKAKMKGDNGEGIAQWTGSKRKDIFWKTLESLEPDARKKYGTITNVPLERQLDVILAERPDVIQAISNAPDIGTATDIMLRGYENGGGTIKTLASKAQIDSIYNKWGNGYTKQMDKRFRNASRLFDSYVEPEKKLSLDIPPLTDVDPTTLYKTPTIDETLFSKTPRIKNNSYEYNPNIERLENMKNMNSLLSIIGVENPLESISNVLQYSDPIMALANSNANGGNLYPDGGDSQPIEETSLHPKGFIYPSNNGYEDYLGLPVEQIGWDEQGRTRFRTQRGTLGTSFEPMDAAEIIVDDPNRLRQEAYNRLMSKRLYNNNKYGQIQLGEIFGDNRSTAEKAFDHSEIYDGQVYTGHGALEQVSPEFDLLMLGRGLLNDGLFSAKSKNVETPISTEVKSTINTTPKINWDPDYYYKILAERTGYDAEDITSLISHLPEYRQIEEEAFKNGALILDKKGNIIVKDFPEMTPNEYVMRQSKAFKDTWKDEHMYTGVSKQYRTAMETDPTSVDSWTTITSPKDVAEYAQEPLGGIPPLTKEGIEKHVSNTKAKITEFKSKLQKAINNGKSTVVLAENQPPVTISKAEKIIKKFEDLAFHYEQKEVPLNGGKVYDIVTPKTATEAPIIDAANSHWAAFPDPDNPGKFISTDEVVARQHGKYDITAIDNVMDTYNGTMLNERIVHRKVPRKSVLGNNGDFNILKKGLFKSLFPTAVSLDFLLDNSNK